MSKNLCNRDNISIERLLSPGAQDVAKGEEAVISLYPRSGNGPAHKNETCSYIFYLKLSLKLNQELNTCK